MARLFTFFLLLFPAFIGLWMSTQAFAARISYNLKFLGSPLFSTDSMMVFSPLPVFYMVGTILSGSARSFYRHMRSCCFRSGHQSYRDVLMPS